MRGTLFEFRHRFYFIAGIFFVGYTLYFVDGVNATERAIDWLAPGAEPGAALPRNTMRTIVLVGAALAALGAALRAWAAAYLRGEVVHDERRHSDRLVADGPYRHVRNPLYVGLMLFVIGMCPMASALGAAFMLVAMPIFLARLVGGEEAAMLAQHGDSFRHFCETVPRFVPSLTPRVPAAGGQPHWGRALLGETYLWVMVAGIVMFAFTFDLRLFGYTSFAGCLAYPLLKRIIGADAPAPA